MIFKKNRRCYNPCLIILWLEGLATNLRYPGSIPGGGPKRFHDSFNFVFYIVGECISCAADTLGVSVLSKN